MRLRPHRGGGGGERPLFIIGAGRSGNTLLRRVLMASDQLFIPPETYVVGRIIEIWPRTVLLEWRERVLLFCAIFEKHRHFHTFGLPNLNEFAHEAAAMPREQRSLRILFERFYLHLARAAGSNCRRWGDKTPLNAHRLAPIGRVFGDAQFLWTVRNGLDVTLSYLQAGLADDPVEIAERWVSANAACAGFARRGRDVRRVDYEALVRRPEEEFRAIFDWAGLTYSPAVLESRDRPLGDVEAHPHHASVSKPITAASIGRWRTQLCARTLDRLPPRFWRMMERLGYAEDAREARRNAVGSGGPGLQPGATA